MSRCGYCAFTSGIYDAGLADAYLAALRREWIARDAGGIQFGTIFIGGGTPSCLSMRQLETLLFMLPRIDGETTCEVNPDTATKEKLRLLRDGGVNRISFGVQTFSPEGLRLLGRRHDAPAALRAVDWAREIGFPNGVSIDLINGWPGQDDAMLREDIAIAASLPIQHISQYNFILEESASQYALYHSLLHEKDEENKENGEDERGKKYWDYIEEHLEKKGFKHYETSNFSQPGFPCRHNVAIWKGGEYLGLGAGAHSHRAGRRFANCDDVETYVNRSGFPRDIEAFSEQLKGEAKARECAVFWLRLFDGVELAEFAERTGYDFCDLYKKELPGLLSNSVMEMDNGRIRVARRYQPLLDMILMDLV
ncbi:MAG: radical SAM family heme chaperone HemW [Planctomycetota bacterium]|nr:radical SAM family heme chaperone HemW [Planctomycetota bacterium]